MLSRISSVGLLIIWSANFTITLGFLVDTFSEAESAITAVERVDAMTRLPTERAMVVDDVQGVPPSTWPAEGRLEFRDVCLRYRNGLPLALDNLSFSVPPGRSVGVVGRTGAGSLLAQALVCHSCDFHITSRCSRSGKSSLTVALFRLVEIESGIILLDGVDLSRLGLSDVRGRKNGMSIIPQVFKRFSNGSPYRVVSNDRSLLVILSLMLV